MKNLKITNPDYFGHVDVIRHACRGIIVKQGKILLSYEQKINQYLIPGGGVEKSENFVECCKREILEETGCLCEPRVNYLDIDELFSNCNHINHYFVCQLTEEDFELHLTSGEKSRGVTFVWVEVDKALAIFSQYEQYMHSDLCRFGLYRREFFALKEYLEYPKIESSAMAVVTCGNKILATNELIYGKNVLSLPKGHNEEGETLIETAIRECFEETNVVIMQENVVNEMPSYFYEFFTPTNEMIRKTITPFHFEVATCVQPLCKEKRILSVQWMDIGDFLNKCPYENVKDSIRRLLQEK